MTDIETFFVILSEYKCSNYPANIYKFKVNNGSTTKRYEICSKLTIKTRISFWYQNY